MYGGRARAKSERWWRWGLGSLALHAGLMAWAHAPRVNSANFSPESTLWMETLPTAAPEPAAPEPAAPEPTPPAPTPSKPKSRHNVPTLRLPGLEPAPTGLEVAGQADTQPAGDAGDSAAAPAADSGNIPETPARPEPSPQFSLWLRPPALQQLVIVRAPSALLHAVPGYRDMLRGSDIAPFTNLERLRVFLPGLSAQRLVLAGVHLDGEAELVRSAERIAATRERAPSWRGSSELRATAWIDGSGQERGLAVHGAAFLIGGRTQLPSLLGEQSPAARVDSLSRTRPEVILSTVIQNISQYLPMLAPCRLRSLRVSVTKALQLSLSAELQSPEDAPRMQSCMQHISSATPELRYVSELLARVAIESGKAHVRLDTGVTSDEISRLLDELCWALRRVAHA